MEASYLAKITSNLHNLDNNEELCCFSDSPTLDNVILAVMLNLDCATFLKVGCQFHRLYQRIRSLSESLLNVLAN